MHLQKLKDTPPPCDGQVPASLIAALKPDENMAVPMSEIPTMAGPLPLTMSTAVAVTAAEERKGNIVYGWSIRSNEYYWEATPTFLERDIHGALWSVTSNANASKGITFVASSFITQIMLETKRFPPCVVYWSYGVAATPSAATASIIRSTVRTVRYSMTDLTRLELATLCTGTDPNGMLSRANVGAELIVRAHASGVAFVPEPIMFEPFVATALTMPWLITTEKLRASVNGVVAPYLAMTTEKLRSLISYCTKRLTRVIVEVLVNMRVELAQGPVRAELTPRAFSEL